MLEDGFPFEEESGIFFFTEDLTEAPELPPDISDWIIDVINRYDGSLHRINYIFCSDRHLLQINREYLDHDTLTDIITFPFNEDPIEADIFISIERVMENAVDRDLTLRSELMRVMIHGVLHLLGFSDKSEEDKIRMRQLEDQCLSLMESNNK